METNKVPLVSVVLVEYRDLDGLYVTLNSIYNQVYPKIQLIVYDDCSPEIEEEELIKAVNKDLPDNIVDIVVHKNHKNLGTVKNLNHAISHVVGQYICLISASDMLADNYVLKNIVKYFEDNQCEICTSKRRVVLPTGDIIIKPTVEEIEKIITKSNKELFVEMSLNHFMGVGTFFRSDVYEKYGKYNENYRLIEDLPYYLNYLVQNGKIYFYDYETYIYMPGGITSKKFDFNSQLNQDRIAIYKHSIFPYLRWFSFKEKRQLYFRYIFECYRNRKDLMILCCVMCPEIFLEKVLKRIRRK